MRIAVAFTVIAAVASCAGIQAETSTAYSGDFAIENRSVIPGETDTGYSDLFAIDNRTTLGGGDTSTGFSGLFKIDNRSGWTREVPPASYAISPYDNAETRGLLRGQLHDHSLPDDWRIYDGSGASVLDQVRRYRDELGYDLLALTDHNLVSPDAIVYPAGSGPWGGWAPYSVEITHGTQSQRPRDAHVLAIGTNTANLNDLDFPTTANITDGVINRVNKVQSKGGLALIAHPSSLPLNPYHLTPTELATVIRAAKPDGISIYQRMSHSEGLWDLMLAGMSPRVWGFVEDDYHPDYVSRGNLGRTWVAVPGDAGESWDAIKPRLRSGNYYSYWVTGWRGWRSEDGSPPVLRVTTSQAGAYPRIRADLTDSAGNPYVGRFTFIVDGQPFDGGVDSWSDISATLTRGYVRVKAVCDLGWGRKLNIASQPILISPGGSRTSGAGSQSGGGLTSTELRLRYLGVEERPGTIPPAGYIGYAFDVTTDTGTVPPGAVLELSYDGVDTSAIGGTRYLAIYRYDTADSAWVKVGGTVDPEAATVQAAIDTLGFCTISADLPTDTTAPEVFIDNPPSSGVVNADTTVKATVNDDLGAWRVSFFLNDHLLSEDSDALDFWTANIRLADYCAGDWTLKAVAEDLAGNQGSAEIPIRIHSSTPRPTVSITSPAPGATLTGMLTVTGTCWDDVAVAAVTLFADGTPLGFAELDGRGGWTAQVDASYLANGPRTLKAVVEDDPGNTASASVTISVANGAASIGDVRNLADGVPVRVDGAVVTAGTPEMSGALYIEAADRSAGIRVATSLTVREGDIVNVAGTMDTANGERQIAASDLAILSSGNPLPGALGSAQSAYRAGLGNTGLLVKLWGRVTAAPEGSGYFYVDDGSALRDGSGHIGIRVYGEPPAEPLGKYVVVTGISSVEMLDGSRIPVVRTRRAGDVAVLTEGQ